MNIGEEGRPDAGSGHPRVLRLFGNLRGTVTGIHAGIVDSAAEPWGTRDLLGLWVIDSRGRTLGRVVGIVRRGGGLWALVSPRLWLLRRARLVPLAGANLHDGLLELPHGMSGSG